MFSGECVSIKQRLYSAARSAESKPVTEAATFHKVTSADLPIAVAQGLPFGATTVSASLWLAHQAGIKVTPFILKRINQATNGGTLPANIALLANNAATAADIAAALAES